MWSIQLIKFVGSWNNQKNITGSTNKTSSKIIIKHSSNIHQTSFKIILLMWKIIWTIHESQHQMIHQTSSESRPWHVQVTAWATSTARAAAWRTCCGCCCWMRNASARTPRWIFPQHLGRWRKSHGDHRPVVGRGTIPWREIHSLDFESDGRSLLFLPLKQLEEVFFGLICDDLLKMWDLFSLDGRSTRHGESMGRFFVVLP